MTGLMVVVTLQHGLGDHAGPRGATLPAHITHHTAGRNLTQAVS